MRVEVSRSCGSLALWMPMQAAVEDLPVRKTGELFGDVFEAAGGALDGRRFLQAGGALPAVGLLLAVGLAAGVSACSMMVNLLYLPKVMAGWRAASWRPLARIGFSPPHTPRQSWLHRHSLHASAATPESAQRDPQNPAPEP
ncbi:MAG: hypothetical protein U1E15_08170 [Hyphomicrobiales bacterium]